MLQKDKSLAAKKPPSIVCLESQETTADKRPKVRIRIVIPIGVQLRPIAIPVQIRHVAGANG